MKSLHTHTTFHTYPGSWQIETSQGIFEPEKCRAVLEEDIVAYWVRGLIDKTVCTPLSEAFLRHPELSSHGVSPRIDYLGVSLFEHDLSSYMHLSDKKKYTMDALFSSHGEFLDVLNDVRSKLAHVLKGYRPMEHSGQQAFSGILRAWVGQDECGNAAKPHDDFIQLQAYPKSEVNALSSLAAQMIYLQSEGGGDLTIFGDRYPTFDEFSNPVLRDGYGWSREMLEKLCLSTRISPRTGDLVFFNSRFIHKISAIPDNAPKRITHGEFVGRKVHHHGVIRFS